MTPRLNPGAYREPRALLNTLCAVALAGIFLAPLIDLFRSEDELDSAAVAWGAMLFVLIAGCLLLGWAILRRPFRHCLLAWRGASSRGRVVEVRHIPQFRGTPAHHEVRYEFTAADGRRRAGAALLRPEDADQLAPDDVIEVWYLRSSPRVSCPALLCLYARDEAHPERAADFLGPAQEPERRVVTRLETRL